MLIDKTMLTDTSNELADTQILDYLEENGGKLSKVYGRIKFPDGVTETFCWQYRTQDICVLTARTARKAIQSHFESKQALEKIQKTKKRPNVFSFFSSLRT